MKTNNELKQGDLLLITLTDPGNNEYFKPRQNGWLLVTEVSVDGKVIQANFMVIGKGNGYGAMIWPKFNRHALLRFTHGECSPYAALKTLENRTGQSILNN